ncbi:MAG: dTMP kinase [Verrucomicrobia bacterium]|nr:dTMP kinase [Verrucomicrobiota bacterium]
MTPSIISRRIRHPRCKGLLISFEGSEGCGKSTQIGRLAARLRRLGCIVHATREPGGTPVGERIRHLLKFSKTNGKMVAEAELLLFSASRSQLVREKILPALSRGEIVLCDRFVDSTTVYQGMARRLDHAFIARLNRFVIAGREPDLTLVLDLDVRAGLSRARKKTKTADRMEAQRLSFYQAVRRGFSALARKNPRRVKLIDSSRSIHDVAGDIWRHTQRLLTR